MQMECRAQSRVAGEWQLLRHGKYPDSFPFFGFRRGVARKDECRFGKIHLVRKRLHFVVAQSSRLGKNGKRVSRERRLRENIELNEIERSLHRSPVAALEIF